MTPEECAQGQLEAYNAHDTERFCSYFSTDVVVLDGHTGEILFEGMDEFKKRYDERFVHKELHCTLVNRMVQENIVIDQESVVGLDPNEVTHAIAIYHVRDQKIVRVVFY
ncbi:MAG: steroid delta-isomerase [Proteobacteria bacterium]|nr:steroid delta-isomerase [Pseudomonadota bacterium]